MRSPSAAKADSHAPNYQPPNSHESVALVDNHGNTALTAMGASRNDLAINGHYLTFRTTAPPERPCAALSSSFSWPTNDTCPRPLSADTSRCIDDTTRRREPHGPTRPAISASVRRYHDDDNTTTWPHSTLIRMPRKCRRLAIYAAPFARSIRCLTPPPVVARDSHAYPYAAFGSA